jgi:hypothetical protein
METLNLVYLLVVGSFCLGGLGTHTALRVTVALSPPCVVGNARIRLVMTSS